MCTSLRVFSFAVPAVFAGLVAQAADAAPLPPAPRVGEAQVRLGEGDIPCFTISEKEERRAGAPYFLGIRVSDAGRREAAPLWLMEMPPGRSFPLMFSMCVPYAGRVASLPQRPAEPLAPGRLYEVLISVRHDPAPPAAAAAATGTAAAAAPSTYAARFCLRRQADGSLALRLPASAARASAACAPE